MCNNHLIEGFPKYYQTQISRKKGEMKPKSGLVLIVILLVTACSSAPSENAVQTAVAETLSTHPVQQEQAASPTVPQPTKTVIPPAIPKPTATTASTATEVPTLVPTPSYSQSVVLLEFGGTGATVSEDYQLPSCWKAVLYWNVASNSGGSASLILTQNNKDTGNDKTLVNEFGMDVGSVGMKGIAFDSLLGGTYYYSTENTNEAWSVRIECQDGVAPVGMGINFQAIGGTVTDNYTLHACNKSIFNWSVEPNSSGTASLILALCDLENNCETIVNEFKMDMTTSLTGQALQAVQAGDYFLVSENTQRSWSVIWECKD
jgi:hypothetical protein